jgi:hypothetical protein
MKHPVQDEHFIAFLNEESGEYLFRPYFDGTEDPILISGDKIQKFIFNFAISQDYMFLGVTLHHNIHQVYNQKITTNKFTAFNPTVKINSIKFGNFPLDIAGFPFGLPRVENSPSKYGEMDVSMKIARVVQGASFYSAENHDRDYSNTIRFCKSPFMLNENPTCYICDMDSGYQIQREIVSSSSLLYLRSYNAGALLGKYVEVCVEGWVADTDPLRARHSPLQMDWEFWTYATAAN